MHSKHKVPNSRPDDPAHYPQRLPLIDAVGESLGGEFSEAAFAAAPLGREVGERVPAPRCLVCVAAPNAGIPDKY